MLFFSKIYVIGGFSLRFLYNFLAVLVLSLPFLIGCGSGGGDSNGANGPGGGGSPDSSGVILLAWDSNTENNLAGYRIYYGTSSAFYDRAIDVGMAITSGNLTTYSLTALTKGQTYCIVVTAYDTSNQESGFSNEACGTAH